MISNPNIISSGLTVHVDFNNPKCYAGPAVKNFATQITPRGTGDNGSTYRFFSMPNETVYIPEIGTVANCPTMDMYNDYNGGSGNCCPSPYTYGNNITVSPSTQYTYAMVYRSFNRYTNANWMYHYEYTSGGSYLTEYGVHSVGGYGASEVHLGNGWYWSRAIFTTNASAGFINTGSWMYQYATWNRFQVAKILIAPGDLRSLHPRYWPEVNTTRSTTSAVTDLTGNATVNLTNLSYTTSGTPNFNGSNNYYTITPNSSFRLGCLDFWLYNNNAVPNNDGAIGGPSSYQSPVNLNNTSTAGVNLGGWTGGASNEAVHFWSHNGSTYDGMTYNRDAVPVGWHNFVFNWNGSTYDIWIDGVKTTTYGHTSIGYAKSTLVTALRVGGDVSSSYYFNGQLPVIKAYSTELTDQQVLQNFNALRGRFGI